jgi:hypothetical protein
MRAHEVRRAVAAAITAIVPSAKAHAGDTFVELPPDADHIDKDRRFVLALAGTVGFAGRAVLAEDERTLELDLTVGYAGTTLATDERALRDSEDLIDALATLEGAGDGIVEIRISGGVPYYTSEGLTITYSLSIDYDPAT